MKIYLVSSDLNKTRVFGDTCNGTPIPRLGESVFVGYKPIPIVINIFYMGDDGTVATPICVFVVLSSSLGE